MLRIAVIEDDRPTSSQFCRWIARAIENVQIEQLFTRMEAEEAVKSGGFDLITLDIELGAERNAGVAIIREATRLKPVPVMVVSGMPADLYRGVMKALDAWDYLQKPVEEHDFIQTLLEILRLSQSQHRSVDENLRIDPLKLPKPTWKGKRLNLSSTQQRILHLLYNRRTDADPTVGFQELYGTVVTGKNQENIRRQIYQIKNAFKDIEPEFNNIVAEPMKGYRWISRT